jgi:hypothetical protein
MVAGSGVLAIGDREVTTSIPAKVFFPRTSQTKLDLCTTIEAPR